MATTLIEKLVDAVRSGKTFRDIAGLAKAVGGKPHSTATALSLALRGGVLTATRLSPRRIDWSTLKATGKPPSAAEASRKKKTSPAPGRVPKRTAKVPRKAGAEASPAAPLSPMDAFAVLFEPSELPELLTLATQAHEAGAALESELLTKIGDRLHAIGSAGASFRELVIATISRGLGGGPAAPAAPPARRTRTRKAARAAETTTTSTPNEEEE